MSTAWVRLWVEVCVCVYVFVFMCACVFCPAAQRRVIQMCVCELYALDKSTLSPVLGLHDPLPVIRHTLFLFGVHCDIWAASSVRVHCGERKCPRLLVVCVCVMLCVRFVSISSLFVHIWLWTHMRSDMQVITSRIIVQIVISGCQSESEGAGFERVLKQPWNKAFLCLDLFKIAAAFMCHSFFSVTVKKKGEKIILYILRCQSRCFVGELSCQRCIYYYYQRAKRAGSKLQ